MSKKIEQMRAETTQISELEPRPTGVRIADLRNPDIYDYEEQQPVRTKKKSGRRKRKKRRRIIICIILLILAVVAFYVVNIFLDARRTFAEIYNPVDTNDLRGQEVDLGNEPFSTLVLGVDSDGPNDFGRTDTIMLVTVNPRLNSTYIVSISRDTMVNINGRYTRINHAFAYNMAGAAGSINAVQDFLNVPIDRYVQIHLEGFSPIIDAVGGIRVYNNTTAFTRYGYHFPLGYIYLTGSSAMHFVQSRHDGDYGRQARQRMVTAAMMNDAVGSMLTNSADFLEATRDNMLTDVSMGDMFTIALNYAGAVGNITNLELRGYGQMVNGMALQVVPEYRRLAMSQRLRDHLELD